MVVGKLDITEKKIRARQADPDVFEPNAFGEGQKFRTIRLSPGVQAIIGIKKGEKGSSVQSILFDKDRFTPEQANVWLRKNKAKFMDALDLENQKVALFNEESLEEHLEGHLPSLTPAQIMRLMMLAGPAETDDGELVHGVPEDDEDYTSRFIKRV